MNFVDKIFHLGDIHIRVLNRHQEYEEVFNTLYQILESRKTPNSIIYLAGDIVHSKVELSPELVSMTYNFLDRLSDICPVYLIRGNHDCNLKNAHRLDALTPIVKALGKSTLVFFDKSGYFRVGQLGIGVMEVADLPINYPKASNIPEEFKIAFFHGAVTSAVTDLGYSITNKSIQLSLFEGYSLTLLGDIHKNQFLTTQNPIAYCGSLIQQGYAESLHHGFLEWNLDVDSFGNTRLKNYEFIEVPNNYGYYTFSIVGGEITNLPKNLPKKLRARFQVQDTTPEQVQKILSKIKAEYEVEEVTFKIGGARKDSVSLSRIIKKDIRDVEYQNSLIEEYLKSKTDASEGIIDRILKYNRNLNLSLAKSQVVRHSVWTPLRFEFSNMFSYGEDNIIDFETLSGIYGIFAPNASGKSSLFDALLFCIFDKSSKTSKASEILNKKKTNFSCKFKFRLNDQIYTVEKVAYRKGKDHIKVDINFFSQDVHDNITSLNGTDREDTNKNIRHYLGSYDDFTLTALSTQTGSTNFIDKTQKERKELLAQFLDITIFEQLHQEASEKAKELNSVIKDLVSQNFEEKLADVDVRLEEAERVSEDYIEKVQSLQEILEKIEAQEQSLLSQLRFVDSTLKSTEELESLKGTLLVKLENTQFKLLECEQAVQNLKTEISNTENQLVILKEKFSGQDINFFDNYKALLEEERGFTRKTTELLLRIENDKRDIEHLKDHKYNPECVFCVQNQFVINARKAINNIEFLKTEYLAVQTSLHRVQTQILELSELKSLHDRILDLKLKYDNYTHSLNLNQQLVGTLKEGRERDLEVLKRYEESLEKAQTQKTTVESNRRIEESLGELRKKKEECVGYLKSTAQKQNKHIIDVELIKKERDFILNNLERLKNLYSQSELYKYYLEVVDKNGIPYKIIEETLPELELEINTILQQIVDFNLVFDTDGKNINGWLVYDNEAQRWPLELGSGMEKFISSLAIRVALIKITTLSKPNFLAIDEGFGVLDSENINNIHLLFDYLRSEFDYIFCISHISLMKDLVDNIITIDKKNGFSKVQ